MGRYEKVLVVDLEATCWENWSEKPEDEKQEIIEVGAVVVNQYQRKIESYGSALIKPTLSTVSQFCQDLTQITPEMLEEDGTERLSSALFNAGVTSCQRVWASWGKWDREMLARDCENKNTVNPVGSSTHINLAQLFTMLKGFKNRKGLSKAMKHMNLSWQDVMDKYDLDASTKHRALPDALMAAEILLGLLDER